MNLTNRKFILRILLIIKMKEIIFTQTRSKATNEETIIEGDQFEYKKN